MILLNTNPLMHMHSNVPQKKGSLIAFSIGLRGGRL